jgi:hypothetical protein
MNGFLAIALPALAGALGTLAVLSSRPRGLTASTLTLVLGSFLGIGLSSLLLPMLIVALNGWPKWYPLAEAGLLLVAILFSSWRIWKSAVRYSEQDLIPRSWPATIAMALLSVISVVTMLVTITNSYETSPHGDWDAVQIWNYHARFLYRNHGEFYRNMMAFSDHHPEYPLFLPSTIARIWIYDGESTLPSAILGGLFAVGSALVLAVALALTRSWSSGLLASAILLSPSWVCSVAGSQYADMPLSFWMLASLAVWALANENNKLRIAMISGLFAGLAAWTKNEGLPFALLLVLAISVRECWTTGLRRAWPVAFAGIVGAAGPVLLNLWWKSLCPFTNDLVAGQTGTFTKLTDTSRWQLIFNNGGSDLLYAFGLSWLFLALITLILGVRVRPAIWGIALALVLGMSGVYFVTYLITPHDLDWHLRTSIKRLAVHLWPMLLLGFFGLIRPLEERLRSRGSQIDLGNSR